MATPSRGVVGNWGEGHGVTTTPYRLACCITELNPGGAERMFTELVCRLDRSRWDVVVISLGEESEPLVERIRSAGIEVRCLGAKRRWDVSVVGRLARELADVSPDVLQTWLYHSNVAGCLAAGRAGIEPVLTGVRVAERRGRLRLWIERFCTRRARRHVCVSQDVAVFCQTHVGLDPRKIEVIVNGVEPERFQRVQPRDLSELGIDTEDRVIAWIGRLDPQKDPLLAIEAFGRLDASFSDCHLVMAGEGPLQGRIESTCARTGLVGRVHLLGRVPDVPQLLARSCGMLLTSRWEGMPNVVLEAMAAGRPVVARLSEGVGDLVEDGVTGWVVSDNQVSSLASAIEQLLSDPRLGFEMGERGCQKVTEDYSIEKMVQQYDAMWEREILESRR